MSVLTSAARKPVHRRRSRHAPESADKSTEGSSAVSSARASKGDAQAERKSAGDGKAKPDNRKDQKVVAEPPRQTPGKASINDPKAAQASTEGQPALLEESDSTANAKQQRADKAAQKKKDQEKEKQKAAKAKTE